jgi:hypothetical protein
MRPNNSQIVHKEKHFYVEHYGIGACIFTAVHFDLTSQGVDQYEKAIKGSESAREKGQGQIVPTLIDESHDKYQDDRLSIVIDCDSDTPEKMIYMGYVALNLLSPNSVIKFVEASSHGEMQNISLAAA